MQILGIIYLLQPESIEEAILCRSDYIYYIKVGKIMPALIFRESTPVCQVFQTQILFVQYYYQLFHNLLLIGFVWELKIFVVLILVK